ncbi:glycosyltransferase family 2 protein [Microbacterium sp. gxy059]|uniref:glycosyltransferase family 2 protein n=1 Tax=Microbacterium sp. gxy059 TaxID=2957199 RepID=UPI003D981A14
MVNPDRSASPLLSVVMPTHNVGPWVRETLQSVLSQSLADLEVLVVDDHSEDDTLDVVERAAEGDPRVRVLNATSRGGGSARNEGVAHARGRFLVFADGDDLIPDGAYSALVESLRASGSDIAIGDYLKFSPVDTWRPTDSMAAYGTPATGTSLADAPTLLYSRPCWNKVFRRDWWVRHDLRFPDVPRSNDIVPMMRAYLAATTIDVIPDVVYLYRARPGAGSMTAQASSAVSVLSYLDQETTCARLVMEQGSTSIERAYARLIYDRDGYLHVARYLSRRTGPTEDDAAVAEAVCTLLETIPAAPGGLPTAKRLTLQLVAEGEFEAARAMTAGNDDPKRVVPDHLAGWARALELIEERALRRAGDSKALLLPIIASLLAPGGGEDPEAWRRASEAGEQLCGSRAVVLVPETRIPVNRLEDALRARDAADGVVTGISGGRTGLVVTGTSTLGSGDILPVLHDAEANGGAPIEPAELSWRRTEDGRNEWRALYPVRALPLQRPLAPALLLAEGAEAVSARCGAELPEYDALDPLLYDSFGEALMVRRRRHWLPRAARRTMQGAARRGRGAAGRVVRALRRRG